MHLSQEWKVPQAAPDLVNNNGSDTTSKKILECHPGQTTTFNLEQRLVCELHEDYVHG
jgi:hypothetical protein